MRSRRWIASELAAKFRQHRVFAIFMRSFAAGRFATAFAISVSHCKRRTARESQQENQD